MGPNRHRWPLSTLNSHTVHTKHLTHPYVNNINQVPRPYQYPPQPTYQPAPRPPAPTLQQNTYPINQGANHRNQEKKIVEFYPIPMTYTELLPRLIQNGQVAPVPMEPTQPPYPRWYDPNARCDYHAGAIGHTVENCPAFKHRVQALIKAGWLFFKKFVGAPNVNNNPLPNHGKPAVNAISEDSSHCVTEQVSEVKMSMRTVFNILNSAGMVQPQFLDQNFRYQGYDPSETCKFHMGVTGHPIQKCGHFRRLVQGRVDGCQDDSIL